MLLKLASATQVNPIVTIDPVMTSADELRRALNALGGERKEVRPVPKRDDPTRNATKKQRLTTRNERNAGE